MPSNCLSILITYYNEGPLLTRCLKSFEFQGVHEIIICDDSSSEPPLPYIPKSMMGLVRVLRNNKNIGPSGSRNRLISQATGDFIHFHDSDDWVFPDWGVRVKEKLQESEAVFTEVSSFSKGNLIAKEVLGLKNLNPEDLLTFALNNFVLVPSGTYRRSVVQELGGYPDRWQSEDYLFHILLFQKKIRVKLIFEPLVGIDIRDSGRSKNRAEVWNCTFEILKSLNLPEKYSKSISDMAFRVGSVLYSEKEYTLAENAFKFSFKMGVPYMSGRSLVYRLLARKNPLLAEKFSAWFQKLKRFKF